MSFSYLKCPCGSIIQITTYLQVLSLSSSWRSLQYSSVCLQEHRQVAGSCKNKRFLLPEQWSQHGSQTLDRKRQTEMGGREREDDYHSVLLPAIRKVTIRSTLSYAPVRSSKPRPDKLNCACDSWVVLHTGSHRAGKYSSSKITLPHAPQTLSHWLDRSQMPCMW